jgi:glycosyltransferase involved in cell wall biosynthesis
VLQPPPPDRQHPLHPLPPRGRTAVAGFESTYLPAAGVDAVDVTGHGTRLEEDLDQVRRAGVRHLRYPLRWQLLEPEPGRFAWDGTDRAMAALQDRGLVPVVDLVHHTSYPDWLADGFRGPDFGPALVRYAEAVARRYPWLPAYTLFNEPFATLFLAGHQALWPPYDHGLDGFRRLLLSVLPALTEVASAYRELLPRAHHVWVDTAEHHGASPGHEHLARVANDRRHVVLDLALGHDLDPDRPFLGALLAGGGEALLGLPTLAVDLLGLDYYSHSEWYYDDGGGRAPSPHPVGLAAVTEHYAGRYGLPLMLTETNVRGLPSDQVSWLRYVLEQYETALARGVPLHGWCWFPQVDSADWNSLLARCAGAVDPVGVLAVAPDGTRRRTVMTDAWEQAAGGLPAGDLPAWRFQSPCDAELAGYRPALAHWTWSDPPPSCAVAAQRVDLPSSQSEETSMSPAPDPAPAPAPTPARPQGEPDLVVLSHLRWPWVWQRPQHVVSRLARRRAAAGARTWFVEEPVVAEVPEPRVRTQERDGVVRAWLELPVADSPHPRSSSHPVDRGFEDPAARGYGELLAELLGTRALPPDVWLYTPMALDLAQALGAGRLVYDVMDDLASFANAPDGLVLRQRRLLAEADVVFTGGPSLHRGVLRQRTDGVHLFRSGVETGHYARSRTLRTPREHPVAGYVGVLDERIDLALVADLVERLPGWTVRMVGPVAKIDAADLPRHERIEYPGMAAYDELPEVMAGFDVALMPFALNDATRSISPTKTLEYLAAGLPVVSTRVPDVVGDYSEVVHLADDADGFAHACRTVLEHDVRLRDRRARPLQARQEWDTIAARMSALVEAAGTAADADRADETA